jgi:hypothetical protein
MALEQRPREVAGRREEERLAAQPADRDPTSRARAAQAGTDGHDRQVVQPDSVEAGRPSSDGQVDHPCHESLDRTPNDVWAPRGRLPASAVGVPPTGRVVAFSEINISRMKDGLMVEHWAIRDVFGVMQQLGAVGSGELSRQ